jgi:hypothetical protein
MMLLAVLGLPVSAAGQDESARIAHGIAVYLGVVPAAMIRGHPADHPERAMHGGIPRGRDSHHVTVALFDAQSGRRIETAAVQAYVALRGSRGTTRQLETMRIADTVTFGNYFNHAWRRRPRHRDHDHAARCGRAGDSAIFPSSPEPMSTTTGTAGSSTAPLHRRHN